MKSRSSPSLLSFFMAVAVLNGAVSLKAQEDPAQSVRRASIPAEAVEAIQGFQLADGIQAELFAAEPLVVNPVAIALDDLGRCFVCETYRQEHGVEDNRNHMDWLDDDLASQTVADRLAMYKKHLGDKLSAYSDFPDRLRLLRDRDGDGKADRATVFVGGFDDPLEGTGAGVLPVRDNVYYTCIPRLWAFRDDDDDGRADRRVALHDGYGVRVAFRGHDLHGLCLGPDGRLYFSMGDRGLHVETKDRVVSNTESGSILRCELDGSRLEIIATGFRNPQELTFDEEGNLFTGDNNSDSGDRARWIHVIPGMDAGWRMAFQYLPDRGPWNRERLWEPANPDQSASIYPPIANLGDGPSGVTYYPGTGLKPTYQGNFFLCDFRGTPAVSGLRTFKMKPAGASFELIDSEIFLWKCLVTDAAFGPDGRLYVSDWVEGWNGSGKGRIYCLSDPEVQQESSVKQVRELLSSGMTDRKMAELPSLLEHDDQRVRQAAQFEIANRGGLKTLAKVLKSSEYRVARLHATWGLGQIARLGNAQQRQDALQTLLPFARDPDAPVRSACTVIFGDNRDARTDRMVVALLTDSDARVRRDAALAAGKLRLHSAVPSLLRIALANAGADLALRHAVAMGLAGCASEQQLASLVEHPSESVRLAAVVGLRRQGSAKVAAYLVDSDPQIASEAARAIHDLPLEDAMPDLARALPAPLQSEAFLSRALNANYRLGQSEHARALAEFASDGARPLRMRQLALSMLATWDHPASRDRVLGMWRPILSERQGMDAVNALREKLPQLLESGQEIRMQATQIAAQLGIAEAADGLRRLLDDRQRTGRERAGALLSLGRLHPDDLSAVVQQATSDGEPRVRAAARMLLTEIDPSAAVEQLSQAIEKGDQIERQSAVEMLASAATESADTILSGLLAKLNSGAIDPPIQLDVLMAGRKRGESNETIREAVRAYDERVAAQKPVEQYAVTLEGGDEERGGRIFFERVAASCLRCHKVASAGGNVGPDLTTIGKDRTRQELLEAIVDPNATITKGFETMMVSTNQGKTISGIVQEKTDDHVVLLTADEQTITLNHDAIEAMSPGQSAMPADLVGLLTPYDLRDLVEFLATRK